MRQLHQFIVRGSPVVIVFELEHSSPNRIALRLPPPEGIFVKVPGDHLQFIEVSNPVVSLRTGVRSWILGRINFPNTLKVCLDLLEQRTVSIMEFQIEIQSEADTARLQTIRKCGFSVAESGHIPGIEGAFTEGHCFNYNRIPVEQFGRHGAMIARRSESCNGNLREPLGGSKLVFRALRGPHGSFVPRPSDDRGWSFQFPIHIHQAELKARSLRICRSRNSIPLDLRRISCC